MLEWVRGFLAKGNLILEHRIVGWCWKAEFAREDENLVKVGAHCCSAERFTW